MAATNGTTPSSYDPDAVTLVQVDDIEVPTAREEVESFVNYTRAK